jgi:hypothetical protein
MRNTALVCDTIAARSTRMWSYPPLQVLIACQSTEKILRSLPRGREKLFLLRQ